MALTSRPESSDALRQLMPPPPPRAPRPQTVLEEDVYSEQVAAIIERDYFPDIPKMHSQLEWLQALNSGDPHQVRQAQVNIARRRAGLKTPQLATPGGAGATGRATPGTWSTPAVNLLRTPAATPAFAAGQTPAQTPGAAFGEPAHSSATPAELRAPSMSLDTYVAKFTSEDNASFQSIKAEEARRKRAKFAHHLEDKNLPSSRQEAVLLLEGGPSTRKLDEYGTSGQGTMTLLPSRHVPLNTLFYDSAQREDAPITQADLDRRVMGPPKVIQKHGTRFSESVGDDEDEQHADGAATASGTAGAAAGTAGYARMVTPALPDESPFMTWGDLESTPLRLDGMEDMPGLDPAGQGPAFKVQGVSRREEVGRRLAAAKSGSAAGAAKRGGSTPLLAAMRRAGGATPVMSPAARQLAANMKKSSTADDPDAQLRASYRATPTPSRVGIRSASVTPMLTPWQGTGLATPAVAAGQRGSVGKASAQGVVVSVPAGQSVTDDLLKL